MMELRSFMLARYAAYAIVAADILLLPLLLSPSAYGEIEYLRYATGFASFMLIGSHTGYLYSLYSEGRDRYTTLVHGGYMVLLLGGIVVALVMNRPALAPAIICAGLAAIFEKRLQASKNFYLAILYRPLVSGLVLAMVALAWLAVTPGPEGGALVAAGFVTALVAWILLVWRFSPIGPASLLGLCPSREVVRGFLALGRRGVVENMATGLLFLFLFADRWLIRVVQPDALPSFSLSFNLAQFALIGINSIGYVAAVRYGEDFRSLNFEAVSAALKRVGVVFVLLAGISMTLAWIYDRWIAHYDGLLGGTALILLGSGVFFVIATTSAIILYANLQIRSTLATGIAVALCYTIGMWMAAEGCSWHMLLLKSAGLLILLSLYNLHLVRKALGEPRG